jgi:glycosyltransferase involved in cell wall biosynthesis
MNLKNALKNNKRRNNKMNKKKINILVTDNQIVYPPESGAPRRIFNLFSNLPKNYDVDYIGVTGFSYLDKSDKKIKSNFKEHTLSLSKPFILVNNFFHNLVRSVPTFDIICYYFMFLNPRYRAKIKNLSEKSDILVATHPWMFSSLRKIRKNKILIYDAHNCEYLLYKEYFKNTLINNLFCKLIFRIERNACRESDLIFACSEDDKTSFSRIYNIDKEKIHLIPNTIDTSFLKKPTKEQKAKSKKDLGLDGAITVLFVGTRYLPNIEALDFMMNSLIHDEKMKHLKFLVVGNIDEYFYENIDTYIALKAGILTKNIKINSDGILGSGFFPLEKWGKTGFDARWTRKKFSFYIFEKKVEKIVLKVRSLKKINGSVYINSKFINNVSFKSGIEFRDFSIDVPSKFSKSKLEVEVVLDRMNKPFIFDTREVGITISDISFFIGNKQRSISLKETILPYLLPKNLIFYGRVDNEKYRKILYASDVAINPVKHGSGINIKMLDYMAVGLPIVTTKQGARGLELDKKYISDLNDFKSKLMKLADAEKTSTYEIYELTNQHNVEKIDSILKTKL